MLCENDGFILPRVRLFVFFNLVKGTTPNGSKEVKVTAFLVEAHNNEIKRCMTEISYFLGLLVKPGY